MIDLTLKATNSTPLMAQLKSIGRRLTHVDEQGADQFSDASHEHALHVFSPLVVTEGTYDEDEVEITPPVLDHSTFALLRTTEEIADLVRAVPGNPSLVLEGAEEAQVMVYRVWA